MSDTPARIEEAEGFPEKVPSLRLFEGTVSNPLFEIEAGCGLRGKLRIRLANQVL